MHLQSTLLVFKKEFLDIVRDKRTMLSMILMPILLIPVLLILVGSVTKSRVEKITEQPSRVAWFASPEIPELRRTLEKAEGVLLQRGLEDTLIAVELLRNRELEAIVVVPDNFEASLQALLTTGDTTVNPPGIRLYADDTRERSSLAARRVSNAVMEYRGALVERSLVEQGLHPSLVAPFQLNRQNIASAEEMGRKVAGGVLPYFIILMMLTGAMYPAIDLTAGEKERGTLETLLVSGVARMDIVLGKFLTVLCAGLITAALCLGSLLVTAKGALSFSAEIARELNFTIDPSSILLLFVVMLPLAVIFSALLMTIAIYAKSYREAQTYVTPLMIMVIFPAMMSMMPDTETTGNSVFIPVLNVSLMMKDALQGSIDPLNLAITMAVNLALAAVCLLLVLNMFKRENVLFRI